MKIIAIDTATEACSAALLIDEEIIERYEVAPREHTNLILPMLESLLAEAGMSLSELDAFAFGRGPGSFTGVRIAASVIQGLAVAVDKPVISISTLRALAQRAFREFQAEYVYAAIDARMHEIYGAGFQLDNNNLMQAISDEVVIDPNKVTVPTDALWIGVGTGWDTYAAQLAEIFNNQLSASHGIYYPSAQDIAYLASFEYKTKAFSAEQAIPTYLRDKITQ